jgi:hypothetical protein
VKDASVQIMATQEKRESLAGVMIARIEEADGMVRDPKMWQDDVDRWYTVMNCKVVCFA